MSKVLPLLSDSDRLAQLSLAFDKPLLFVEECVRAHNVERLPHLRFAGDGLDGFYSDMSSSFCLDKSLTKQEFTSECDVNVIMDRFIKGGDISVLHVNPRQPLAGDATTMPSSYHEALNFVKDTERAFMELPAKVRAKFDNDPGRFLDFVQDPANAEQLVELGLAVLTSPISGAPDTDKALEPEKGGVSKKPVSKPVSGDSGGGE